MLWFLPIAGFLYLAAKPKEAHAMTTATRNTWAGPLPALGKARWIPSEKSRPYIRAALDAEKKYKIPTGLLARLLQQESMWNPNAVNARSGATGIAQFMPATAKEYGLTNRRDPWASIDAAARYLVWLHKYLGGWAFAIGGYNWGPGNVKRKGLWNAPDETRQYIDRISGDILGINYAAAVMLQQDQQA